MRMRSDSTTAVASDERVVPRTRSIDTRKSGHPFSGERTFAHIHKKSAQKNSSIYKCLLSTIIRCINKFPIKINQFNN